MLDLSSANRTAISSDVPWPVDFLEVEVTSTNILLLTNHFHDITVGGKTYLATSHFLNFSDIADNLEVKDNTLDVSLSGVDAVTTALVLANPIEGSLVTVSRGFYLESTGLLADGIYQRWSGRVNNYSITDDYSFTYDDKIIISLSCKSLLTTLIAKVSGRYTSPQGFNVGIADIVVTGITSGVVYRITTLGNTTQAQWNTAANTTGVTYAVGSRFTSSGTGTGTGTVEPVELSMEFVPSLPAFNPNFGSEE